MKYYLIVDLGYDGLAVIEFDNKDDAMKRYGEDLLNYDGVTLIEGTVLQSSNLELSV